MVLIVALKAPGLLEEGYISVYYIFSTSCMLFMTSLSSLKSLLAIV